MAVYLDTQLIEQDKARSLVVTLQDWENKLWTGAASRGCTIRVDGTIAKWEVTSQGVLS
jgi:hypothetical protein